LTATKKLSSPPKSKTYTPFAHPAKPPPFTVIVKESLMSHWKKNHTDQQPASEPSPSSRNAMKHGCCANNTLLLSTESEEDLKTLEVIWLKAYNPASETERHLVQELAHADWFLQRATRSYNNVEAGLYEANPNPVDWTEAQERKLGRFLRYKTAHTNNVIRCQKRVEDYRKARAAEQLKQEKKEKPKKVDPNAPMDWKQKLREMREQAIAMGYTPPEMPDPPRF